MGILGNRNRASSMPSVQGSLARKKPTANHQDDYFRYQFIFLESTAKDHHTIDFNCDDSKQQKTSQNRHDHFPFMR